MKQTNICRLSGDINMGRAQREAARRRKSDGQSATRKTILGNSARNNATW